MEKLFKRITCYQDALDIRKKLAPCQTSGLHFLYRGHASTQFKLLSTIGRKSSIDGDRTHSEMLCYNEFKDIAKTEDWIKYKIGKYDSDMYYMSIGRHIGLDCRLLDWTARLETALFFASQDAKYSDEDGQLWVMLYQGRIDDSNARKNPFAINEFTIVKEDYLLLDDDFSVKNHPLGRVRQYYQNGFFTITPSDQITTPIDKIATKNVQFISFIIDSKAKEDILKNLTPQYNDFLKLTHSRIEDDIKEINAKYFK